MIKGLFSDHPLSRILSKQMLKRPGAVQDQSSLVNKRFLSDTQGKIGHILVSSVFSSTPSAVKFFGGKQNLMDLFLSRDYRRIRSLLANTDRDVKVTVLHQGEYLLSGANPNLSMLKKNFGGRVNIVSLDFQPMLWVQDRFIVFEDKTVFVRASDPNTDEHFAEEGLPVFRFAMEYLGDLGFKVIMSPSGVFNLMREADLMVTDEFVFLGPKTVMDTYRILTSGRTRVDKGTVFFETDGSAQAVVNAFANSGKLSGGLKDYAETLARDLKMIAGGKEVVIPHLHGFPVLHGDLDMVMTPLGGKLVAVADISLAGEIAKRLIQEGFNYVSPGTKKEILHEYRFEQKELDGIARGLSERGFTVLRIPFLNRLEKGDKVIPWCSYNNVLVEIFGNIKRIYMPVYGIGDLDEMAARIYADAGFEVRRIEGVGEIAKLLGVLRCSCKILERRSGYPNPAL